ncbi:MAG: acyclic terpene utilization AtuA family protein [Acidimicrobiales bacterium]
MTHETMNESPTSNRPTADRPIRVANCSGFYGDRLSAMEEVVTGGAVDVVTGDYLAEVTMLVLARSRMKRPDGGYAATFLRQIAPIASEIARRNIRVVVNAGGLNPAGMAQVTRELLEQAGVELVVAHIEGDDLTGRMAQLQSDGHSLTHLDTGTPFSKWGHEVLTANAYLGAFGIKTALAGGADIVVTGRVADASLAVGAAAWWWDWQPDDINALAGAVVAGHVIECGPQATGGNFSGFQGIEGLTRPGFPLAEIDVDGGSVITKHPGTGGAVTVDTVTAQLLYEIGDPSYKNPDVVARMDTVHLEQVEADRVRIFGVAGEPPPATTKVAVTGVGAWRNSVTVVLTGLEIDKKAELFETTIRQHFGGDPDISDLRFTRIGTAAVDAPDQMAASCMVQVSVDGDESSCGRAFSSFVVELALSNFPGVYYTEPPGAGGPFGVYWPAIVDQSLIEQVVVHQSGLRESIPFPAGDPVPRRPDTDDGESRLGRASGSGVIDGSATVEAPLGAVVNARSGDKGGKANVGVWVGSDQAWEWLRSTLSVERLKELLPETSNLTVDRFELPNLRAINFVVHDLLDGGATEARRFDKQAKALGEWLRSRYVSVPSALLEA